MAKASLESGRCERRFPTCRPLPTFKTPHERGPAWSGLSTYICEEKGAGINSGAVAKRVVNIPRPSPAPHGALTQWGEGREPAPAKAGVGAAADSEGRQKSDVSLVAAPHPASNFGACAPGGQLLPTTWWGEGKKRAPKRLVNKARHIRQVIRAPGCKTAAGAPSQLIKPSSAMSWIVAVSAASLGNGWRRLFHHFRFTNAGNARSQ